MVLCPLVFHRCNQHQKLFGEPGKFKVPDSAQYREYIRLGEMEVADVMAEVGGGPAGPVIKQEKQQKKQQKYEVAIVDSQPAESVSGLSGVSVLDSQVIGGCDCKGGMLPIVRCVYDTCSVHHGGCSSQAGGPQVNGHPAVG